MELERLSRLFDDGQRLVTLWGPGGAGKTRLAREYAAQQKLPVTFCDLSETRTPSEAASVVVQALALEPIGGAGELGAELGRAIDRRGPLLLILDNFEQLIEAAAGLVSSWIGSAPRARILVTSRERLRLVQELAVELPPLALPESSEQAASSEAVELFVDRVRAQRPDFALTEQNAEAVTTAVCGLEGLPLAIELAAARFDVLGLEGISARLGQQSRLLTRAPRDAIGRHATLQNAIEWSWSLLGAVERDALAQCSIFRGGFALEAAEAVVRIEGAELLDVLQDLRDKSLLRTFEGSEGRFGMLESIRQVAEEKLRDGAQPVAERHTEFFLRAGAEWAGSSPPDLPRLVLELSNLTAVLERALSSAPSSALASSEALRAALALDPVHAARGPYAAYLALLDRVLHEAAAGEAMLRAKVLRARGKTRQVLGQFEGARDDFEHALELARASGASREEGSFLIDLGVLHHQRRDFDRATSFYQQALERARQAGHRREIGRALGNLGAIHHDRRELEPAQEHYRQALAIHREVGDRRLQGIFSTNLGILEHECGHLHAAMECYGAALELLEAAGDRRLLAITLGNRAVLSMELGRLDDAQQALERATELGDELGDQRTRVLCHARLGVVAAMLGKVDEARAELACAEDLAGRPQDPLALELVALSRGFLDAVQARRAFAANRPEEAAELALAARTRIDRARAVPPGSERALIDRSDDARLTIRLLEQALAAIGGGQPAEGEGPALMVAPGARWFQPPAGEWVDFRRRKPLRLVLLKLIEQRLEAPGRALPLELLVEAGWPGEKIQSDAAQNRMYVALATLRKLGLKELLLSGDQGYALDPSIPVRWVERSPEDEEA